MLSALEEKDIERYSLLSAIKEDHLIGLEEIEIIKQFSMIVEEASDGLDIHLKQKKLITEILAADFLNLTSTAKIVDGKWPHHKDILTEPAQDPSAVDISA